MRPVAEIAWQTQVIHSCVALIVVERERSFAAAEGVFDGLIKLHDLDRHGTDGVDRELCDLVRKGQQLESVGPVGGKNALTDPVHSPCKDGSA